MQQRAHRSVTNAVRRHAASARADARQHEQRKAAALVVGVSVLPVSVYFPHACPRMREFERFGGKTDQGSWRAELPSLVWQTELVDSKNSHVSPLRLGRPESYKRQAGALLAFRTPSARRSLGVRQRNNCAPAPHAPPLHARRSHPTRPHAAVDVHRPGHRADGGGGAGGRSPHDGPQLPWEKHAGGLHAGNVLC